jgi:hypothetical protein
MNHIKIEKDQWVDGAKIVCGFKGTSKICDQERMDQYEREIRDMGVDLLDKPEDMIGEVDGVLIESVDGSVHLERARPFIKKGLPLYIDKPFTCSVAHAKKLVSLAAKKNVPLFSSSSLRYALEVVEVKNDPAVGSIVGANVFSPASLHPPVLDHTPVTVIFAILAPRLGPQKHTSILNRSAPL